MSENRRGFFWLTLYSVIPIQIHFTTTSRSQHVDFGSLVYVALRSWFLMTYPDSRQHCPRTGHHNHIMWDNRLVIVGLHGTRLHVVAEYPRESGYVAGSGSIVCWCRVDDTPSQLTDVAELLSQSLDGGRRAMPRCCMDRHCPTVFLRLMMIDAINSLHHPSLHHIIAQCENFRSKKGPY